MKSSHPAFCRETRLLISALPVGPRAVLLTPGPLVISAGVEVETEVSLHSDLDLIEVAFTQTGDNHRLSFLLDALVLSTQRVLSLAAEWDEFQLASGQPNADSGLLIPGDVTEACEEVLEYLRSAPPTEPPNSPRSFLDRAASFNRITPISLAIAIFNRGHGPAPARSMNVLLGPEHLHTHTNSTLASANLH